MTVQTASRWHCDRCGMSAGMQSGEQTPLPNGWAGDTNGCFCLICRRERAAEEALREAPAQSTSKDRADLRRDAILGFEVSRDPSRSNAQIAQACRSSVSAVATVRDRLGLPEDDPVPRARSGTRV